MTCAILAQPATELPPPRLFPYKRALTFNLTGFAPGGLPRRGFVHAGHPHAETH